MAWQKQHTLLVNLLMCLSVEMDSILLTVNNWYSMLLFSIGYIKQYIILSMPQNYCTLLLIMGYAQQTPLYIPLFIRCIQDLSVKKMLPKVGLWVPSGTGGTDSLSQVGQMEEYASLFKYKVALSSKDQCVINKWWVFHSKCNQSKELYNRVEDPSFIDHRIIYCSFDCMRLVLVYVDIACYKWSPYKNPYSF